MISKGQQDYERIQDFEDGFDIRDGVAEVAFIPKSIPAKFCPDCNTMLRKDGTCPNCGGC